MKKICMLMTVILLLGAVGLVFPVSADTASDGYYHGEMTSDTYWLPIYDKLDYDLYRLPGVVVTKAGTVIAYGEARRLDVNRDNFGSGTNGDLCEMDLYLRRSTDGGESFGDRIWIAKGAEYYENGYGETINNPVMIVGNDGRLHLLYTCNLANGGLWYTYSDDDGVTWSTPRNTVSTLQKNVAWTQIACGVGHGVCLSDGTLMTSAWVYEGSYKVRTLYSKDNGATWQFGELASSNRDETAIVELSDGSVMLNSRQYSYPYDEATPNRSPEEAYRAVTVSPNGIDNWSTTEFHKTLIDPACEGNMCAVDLEGLPYAVLFVNNASKTDRNHLTVRCSFDDGRTWEKSILIDENYGGYSDIAVDENGKVYVLYEIALGSRVQLVTFSFYDVFCAGDDRLTNNTTSFTDPHALVSGSEGVTLEKSGNGALKVTLTDNEVATAVIDATKVTNLLNADEMPIFAMRVKANAQADVDEVKCGVYFRCGYTNTSQTTLYSSFTVANDGEYHTVQLDLSSRDAYGGNLYGFEIVFCPPGGSYTVGDTYEIAEFGFFATKADADAAYPASDPAESETNAKGGDDQGTGCASSVEIGTTVFAALTLGSVAFAVGKKRRNK